MSGISIRILCKSCQACQNYLSKTRHVGILACPNGCDKPDLRKSVHGRMKQLRLFHICNNPELPVPFIPLFRKFHTKCSRYGCVHIPVPSSARISPDSVFDILREF